MGGFQDNIFLYGTLHFILSNYNVLKRVQPKQKRCNNNNEKNNDGNKIMIIIIIITIIIIIRIINSLFQPVDFSTGTTSGFLK